MLTGPVLITKEMTEQDCDISSNAVGSWGVKYYNNWFYHSQQIDAERLVEMFKGNSTKTPHTRRK